MNRLFRYWGRRLTRGESGTTMGGEFQTPDWDLYHMDLKHPFTQLESEARESKIVRAALRALHDAGMLANDIYDEDKYRMARNAARQLLDIPWSALTPRMQRLLYAINAIHQPQVLIAAGVFCGYTFLANASAAVGPGSVYRARELIGLEINPQEAARSELNVRAFDSTGTARILARDAIAFCRDWPDRIDLLYLDADGDAGRGKAIYREILDAAWDKLAPGGLLMAHNSVNASRQMRSYLEFVRDPKNCRASLNIAFDPEGLEVSVR